MSTEPEIISELCWEHSDQNADQPGSRGWLEAPSRLWNETLCRFLQAIEPDQREPVEHLMQHLHHGGSGLRSWITAIVWRGASLPEKLPREVIEVYLHDPEAVPLYDCQSCRMALPVRPNPWQGADAEPERVYFSICPVCGGSCGPYLLRKPESSAT